MIKNFFEWLGSSTVTQIADISYYPCLIIALVSLILYMSGQKKAGKYVPTSIVIYFLIQCFKAASK